jgi:hypothetical protein
METENADIVQMRETVAHSDMHALQHIASVDERDDMWKTIEAQQEQIDALYERVMELERARL